MFNSFRYINDKIGKLPITFAAGIAISSVLLSLITSVAIFVSLVSNPVGVTLLAGLFLCIGSTVGFTYGALAVMAFLVNETSSTQEHTESTAIENEPFENSNIFEVALDEARVFFNNIFFKTPDKTPEPTENTLLDDKSIEMNTTR